MTAMTPTPVAADGPLAQAMAAAGMAVRFLGHLLVALVAVLLLGEAR